MIVKLLSKKWFLVIMVVALLSSCNSENHNELIEELKAKNQVLTEKLNSYHKTEKQLELNKQIVTGFFKEVFIDMQLDSIHKYIGDTYIQHDPNIADGKQALINEIEKWFEHMSPNNVDIIRTFAEDDLVFIHTKNRSGQPVLSLMHVFRIENKEIVEHWISVQPVPENPANDNTLF